jgi:hypothetical protein
LVSSETSLTFKAEAASCEAASLNTFISLARQGGLPLCCFSALRFAPAVEGAGPSESSLSEPRSLRLPQAPRKRRDGELPSGCGCSLMRQNCLHTCFERLHIFGDVAIKRTFSKMASDRLSTFGQFGLDLRDPQGCEFSCKGT